MVATETPTTKAIIRKAAGKWRVTCPCGFTWTSRFHRLALLMATSHGHLRVAA